MKIMGYKYFLYARKSSESSDRQIQSIDDQIDRLKILAKDKKLEIVDILFESKSAKKPYIRKVFDDMIRRINKGEANGILCWEMNRLSRNPIDSATIQWSLQEGVIKSIQTITREYLPDDNAVVIGVESASANQFIQDMKRNVKRGIDSKLTKGLAPIVAPIGYLNTKFESRGENSIKIDPERFKIVRKMWDLMLTGNYSVPQIRDIATNEWGLLTLKRKKIGGGPMGYTSAYNMFGNIFYTGYFVYRKQEYKGGHKPMITMAEFNRVQSLLKAHGNPRPKNHEFAYGCGAFICEECGRSIVGIEKIKYLKSLEITKSYTFYLCGHKKSVVYCSQKHNINEIELEEQIKEEVAKYSFDKDFLRWTLEVMKDNDVVEVQTKEDIKENVAKTLEGKEEELKKLIQLAARGLISDEEFKESRVELDKIINNMKSQLNEKESDKNKDLMELTEKAFIFSTYALIGLQNGNKRKKKEIAKGLGMNRTIKDKKLFIQANKWYNEIRKGYFSIKEVLAGTEPEICLKQKTINDFDGLRSILRGRWVLTPRPLP